MIAVIGGSGFLGTTLINKIMESGASARCLDKVRSSLNVPFSFFDVETKNIGSELEGSDVIINLAAEHRDNVRPRSLYTRVNVEGARNVCHAASNHNVNTIIFTSSVAVYGFAPMNTGEDGSPLPFNDYGRTKYEAELVYREWQEADPYNRSLVIIRPTVIFGPGNRGNVFNLLSQIASRKFAMFGDGKNIKSMAYVENVADFILHVKNMGPGCHLYNYIDKPDLDMNALVLLTRKTLFAKNNIGVRLPAWLGILIGWVFDGLSFVLRRPLPISSIRVKKFLTNSQYSSRAAETGFIARHSLEAALKTTLQYEFLESNAGKQTFESE